MHALAGPRATRMCTYVFFFVRSLWNHEAPQSPRGICMHTYIVRVRDVRT